MDFIGFRGLRALAVKAYLETGCNKRYKATEYIDGYVKGTVSINGGNVP